MGDIGLIIIICILCYLGFAEYLDSLKNNKSIILKILPKAFVKFTFRKGEVHIEYRKINE